MSESIHCPGCCTQVGCIGSQLHIHKAETQLTNPTNEQELDEQLSVMIERDAMALCCNDCGGGGYDYDNTKKCDTCKGTGLTEWQIALLEQWLPPIMWEEVERLNKADFARWCS